MPTGLPGWDPNRVVLDSCGESVAAADEALTDAARIYNSIGKPVTAMLVGEPLLMISCAHCGEAITSEMRVEAEIIEDVDGFYEIEKTTMANNALEAALKASELVGIFVVEGGIRTVSQPGKRGCTHEPGGVTINTIYNDKW